MPQVHSYKLFMSDNMTEDDIENINIIEDISEEDLNGDREDVYREDMDTVRYLSEHLEARLGFNSGQQNMMVQSIGILMAFASIVLVEVLRSSTFSLELSNIIPFMSVLMLTVCCACGVYMISLWREWAATGDEELSEAVKALNNREWIKVQANIWRGLERSNEHVRYNIYTLKRSLVIMAITLGSGLGLMIIEWLVV